jgi:uncharacterized protein (DUF1697 family)
MADVRYVALLRGINVGGNNVIRMADLRACFEGLGFSGVETYIQSGNVVFAARSSAARSSAARSSAARSSQAQLALAIEKALSNTFAYSSRIVLLSAAELSAVVLQAPPGFGTQADKYRYDVIFPKAPLTPAEALPQLSTKPGVDVVLAGDQALYFRRLIARATQSRLSKLTQLPLYQTVTVRNWNTTTRLLEMALLK